MRVTTGSKTLTANAALAPYLRVKLSSGELVVAGAEDREIGTLDQRVLAADDPAAVVPRAVDGTVMMVASAAISQYAKVYGAASGKVSSTANSNFIGIAMESASGDGSQIEVLRIERPSNLAYANVAASAEVENTTAETAFDKSFTVDGASLQAGDVLKVRAQGVVVDNNSTDTLNVKLYLGTEEIAATGAVDVADGDIFFIDATIVVRTVGATGTIVACGLVGLGVIGTVTAKPFLKAQATEDISGNVAITVKGTWSVAHADNEVRLDILTVERLNA